MQPDFFAQLMQAYTFDNAALLIASVTTFGFGFWEYIYSFRLVKREGSAPFPIWMHTFYFAHDSTFGILFLIAASQNNWHWLLTGVAIALFVWTAFELYNFYKAVTIERQEIWGRYYGKNVTARQAIVSIILQLAVFYSAVNVVIMYIGPGCMFQWAALTNMVMATMPGLLWRVRGSRKGSGMGIALVILGGTINTFLPCGMFVLALPEVFDHPWFYIAGVVFAVIALRNVWMMHKFPPKHILPDGKKPIW